MSLERYGHAKLPRELLLNVIGELAPIQFPLIHLAAKRPNNSDPLFASDAVRDAPR
jgi:hypothetical protein